MPFSEAQKMQFIALLQAKGWELRDGTICSASGGLWFDDSHFGDWSPSEMHDVFTRRFTRIANAQVGDDCQRSSRENYEVSCAAKAVAAL
jgi:hypothetical protein